MCLFAPNRLSERPTFLPLKPVNMSAVEPTEPKVAETKPETTEVCGRDTPALESKRGHGILGLT